MTEDRDEKIKKDLLWDYTKTVSALEALRVNFRALADRFDSTAKMLREHPEDLATFDFADLQTEFDTAIASIKEYSEMLRKNAERKTSLIKMGVLP